MDKNIALALRVHNRNGEIHGKLEEVSLGDLLAGEVLIKIAYSSVNYKDALAATGRGGVIREFPRIPGIDMAGYVAASRDERFKEGDAVLATGYEIGSDCDGGYATYAKLPADWLIPLPVGISPYQAMALGTAGFTVALCVWRLESNGQTPEHGLFAVTGATGGVGSIAIDVLSHQGYEVTAITGKTEARDYLLSLGASAVMMRQSISASLKPLATARWGGAIDNIGGDCLAWLLRTVKPWGNIVSVGLAGGSHLNSSVMPFILRGITLLGVTSSGAPHYLRQELWSRLFDDLAPRKMNSIVHEVIKLPELPEAFDRMLRGRTQGRIVVAIAPEK